MFYSIVVAAYKRADEIEEFFRHIVKQQYKDFEVIISDGSPDDSLRAGVMAYASAVNLKYVYKKDFKASESRNLGVTHAKGDYVIFIDSDCIVPETYLQEIDSFLQANPADAFGGPDMARDDFNPVMKAINYAMTSYLTTGGIRGKKKHVGQFELRGFNMGISKKAFEALNGFSTMQVAEDIELSARVDKAGYAKRFIPNAGVYHKRKSNFDKFFKQLRMHGKGRIDLYLRHPEKLKPLHFLPTAFVVYLFTCLLVTAIIPQWGAIMILVLIFYFGAIFIDSSIFNKSIYVGLLSCWSSFLMLFSYGIGLMENFWKRIVIGKNREIDKDEILKL
jgi:cellulose synthase/poly-beta-1,6-N-acetylglucosamine synthase-like glycosyltransferase